jgi:hypothetical protein
MDDIINFADLFFEKIKNKLKERIEIKTIELINETLSPNYRIQYFEIQLKEEYLNEKDIDLFDIEISYQKINNNKECHIKIEFYASDGVIFKEISILEKNPQTTKNKVQLFINECIEEYKDVVKTYIGRNC